MSAGDSRCSPTTRGDTVPLPQLKWHRSQHRNGKQVKKYDGPREKDAIRAFLENPNAPPPPPPPPEKVGERGDQCVGGAGRLVFPTSIAYSVPPFVPPPPSPKSWADEENDVVHLSGDTFDTELAKHDSALVFMYAPWCGTFAPLAFGLVPTAAQSLTCPPPACAAGHCKSFKGPYAEAAAHIKGASDIGGVLAAADCTAPDLRSICTK